MSQKEKWQEIANRGLQDQFDPETRVKFDEAVRRGLITVEPPQEKGRLQKVSEAMTPWYLQGIQDFTADKLGMNQDRIDMYNQVPESAMDVVTGAVEMVKHPLNTLQSLGNLELGVLE